MKKLISIRMCSGIFGFSIALFSLNSAATILSATINHDDVSEVNTSDLDYFGGDLLHKSNENFVATATPRAITVTGDINNDNFLYQNLEHGVSAYSQTRFELKGGSDIEIFFTFKISSDYSLTPGISTIQMGWRTNTQSNGGYELAGFGGGFTDYGDRGGVSGWFLEGQMGSDTTSPIRSLPETYDSKGQFTFDSYAGKFSESNNIGEFGMSAYVYIEGVTSANYSVSLIDAFYFSEASTSSFARSVNLPYLLFDDGSQMMLTAKPFVEAVPEPETYSLMMLGVGMISFLCRRRTSYIA